MLALLEIDEYFVDGFSLEANPSFNGQEQERHDTNFEIDFAMARSSDGQPRFEIKLFVSLNKKEEAFFTAPYRLTLQVTGYFHFSEGTDEDLIKKMMAPNGLAILYGIARNLASQMTGMGRFGRVLLPTLNFIEIIRDKAKKQEISSEA